MKICMTMQPQKIAFGGGNQFALNLVEYFEKNKIKVVYDLKEQDINGIFIMDPRILKFNKIDLQQIQEYKKKNPKVKIFHRVNDCDKPRGEVDNLDKILKETFKIADLIIFVSKWTKNYFNVNSLVINNGCNRNYFYPKYHKKLNNPVKIVTHHWSGNANKGKDIYEQLDKWTKNTNYEFLFIGRDFPSLSNVKGPYFGLELGNKLRECDIYISASQFENCPMHVIEGLACGLPLLYHKNIGGGVEIGEAHGGESFDTFDDLINKLKLITENYQEYQKKINHKLLSSDLCCELYYKAIKSHL